MSRVAKNPIVIPANVQMSRDKDLITVKGPLGALSFKLVSNVEIEQQENTLHCKALDLSQSARAMSGTVRAIVANMVKGVSVGFERKLNLVGVGYRAQAQGDTLNLSLGFSHPVAHKMPVGIKVETPTQTEIIVKGVDKQVVGQIAAEIRAYRKPEPYKGKGVRYSDEVVILKETKKK